MLSLEPPSGGSMHRQAVRAVLGAVTGVMAWSLPVVTPFAQSGADVEVLELDRRIGDAVVRGDAVLVDSMTADDFVMVHGDGWTHGGQPLLTDGKASLLQRVKSRYYDVIDFDSVQAELHGDVAITHGRYVAHVASGNDRGEGMVLGLVRTRLRETRRSLDVSVASNGARPSVR